MSFVRLMAGLLSRYVPSYPRMLVYMMQSTEYQSGAYMNWYWRTVNFRDVMHRRTLERTQAARLLVLFITMGLGLQYIAALAIGAFALAQGSVLIASMAVILLLLAPFVWAHIAIIAMVVARKYIIEPKTKRLLADATAIFAAHKGVRIAVAGSYGKTTAKEILATVLREGKTVAATPANKNVATSHAQFARSLQGNEDVLVIEYGEGKPGDVAAFVHMTKPHIGVITGIAPAHLDFYKSTQAAAEDIFSLTTFVEPEKVYVNADSRLAQPFIKPGYHAYTRERVGDWRIEDVSVGYEGMNFTLKRGDERLELTSKLLGKHLVGVLAMSAVLALELGLTHDQVKAGIAATEAYEHRMRPYQLNGAWIIDDTYNGNLEGIRAGVQLLSDLPAKRKLYVTPGLVDQGEETEQVHLEIGDLIASAAPDIVVLMHNSVMPYIRTGLERSGYKGEVRVESDPLQFYTNISHFVAVGDLVVMQNDWTDNYR